MPNVPDNYISALNNQMIMKELSYDRSSLKKELASFLKSLTDEQHKVYQTVMNAVAKGNGGVFFYMVTVELVKHFSGKHLQLPYVPKVKLS